MNNKIIIGVLGVLVVAALGYIVFLKMPSQSNPPAGDQAKINVEEVCRGALAYMTFADAASAEVFVTECKEGKHPEVIEQYKAQMGLDGATI